MCSKQCIQWIDSFEDAKMSVGCHLPVRLLSTEFASRFIKNTVHQHLPSRYCSLFLPTVTNQCTSFSESARFLKCLFRRRVIEYVKGDEWLFQFIGTNMELLQCQRIVQQKKNKINDRKKKNKSKKTKTVDAMPAGKEREQHTKISERLSADFPYCSDMFTLDLRKVTDPSAWYYDPVHEYNYHHSTCCFHIAKRLTTPTSTPTTTGNDLKSEIDNIIHGIPESEEFENYKNQNGGYIELGILFENFSLVVPRFIVSVLDLYNVLQTLPFGLPSLLPIDLVKIIHSYSSLCEDTNFFHVVINPPRRSGRLTERKNIFTTPRNIRINF